MILHQQYTVSFEAADGETMDMTFRASSDVDAQERAAEEAERLAVEDPHRGWCQTGVRGPFVTLPTGQVVACQSA